MEVPFAELRDPGTCHYLSTE